MAAMQGRVARRQQGGGQPQGSPGGEELKELRFAFTKVGHLPSGNRIWKLMIYAPIQTLVDRRFSCAMFDYQKYSVYIYIRVCVRYIVENTRNYYIMFGSSSGSSCGLAAWPCLACAAWDSAPNRWAAAFSFSRPWCVPDGSAGM